RSRAAPARRASGKNAPAARDGRASVRDAQGADGSNPFPYEDAATRRHRNGASRPRLQSNPRHQHHGARTADRSDQDVALAVRMSLLASNAVPPFEVRTARTREPSSRHSGWSTPDSCNRNRRHPRPLDPSPPAVFARPGANPAIRFGSSRGGNGWSKAEVPTDR